MQKASEKESAQDSPGQAQLIQRAMRADLVFFLALGKSKRLPLEAEAFKEIPGLQTDQITGETLEQQFKHSLSCIEMILKVPGMIDLMSAHADAYFSSMKHGVEKN